MRCTPCWKRNDDTLKRNIQNLILKNPPKITPAAAYSSLPYSSPSPGSPLNEPWSKAPLAPLCIPSPCLWTRRRSRSPWLVCNCVRLVKPDERAVDRDLSPHRRGQQGCRGSGSPPVRATRRSRSPLPQLPVRPFRQSGTSGAAEEAGILLLVVLVSSFFAAASTVVDNPELDIRRVLAQYLHYPFCPGMGPSRQGRCRARQRRGRSYSPV